MLRAQARGPSVVGSGLSLIRAGVQHWAGRGARNLRRGGRGTDWQAWMPPVRARPRGCARGLASRPGVDGVGPRAGDTSEGLGLRGGPPC